MTEHVYGFENINREDTKQWLLSNQAGHQVKDNVVNALQAMSRVKLLKEHNEEMIIKKRKLHHISTELCRDIARFSCPGKGLKFQ